MEQEIWHDDLYATRNNPVKPRQHKHKSCVIFASDAPMIADSISDLTGKKINFLLEKAMECERLLNKKDRRFYLFSEQVAKMYKSAKSECESVKLKDFCDTRAKLVMNEAKIWVKENA